MNSTYRSCKVCIIEIGEAVENSNLPEKPIERLVLPPDDIPEALRETTEVAEPPRFRFKWKRWMWVGLGLAIALIIGLFFRRTSQLSVTVAPANLNSVFTPALEQLEGVLIQGGVELPQTLLGHLPYKEAPPESLESIVPDGSIKLRRAAARQFLAMAEAARRQGVYLIPISGYRSIADQEYLFFQVKAERGQAAVERAEVSAPPGYSEHHTGYAIDIGDGSRTNTELQVAFETTSAFRWLQQNAAYYSFELSFPPNNSSGVSYEPWHWRYVGDRDSLETFYRARGVTGG